MSRHKKKPCSPKIQDIEIKYKTILEDIKFLGYKVVHKKLPKDVAGYFNPDTYGIEVDKTIKNTLEGCYCLLHELFHAIDYREGKFKKFFKMEDDEEFSEEKLQLIIEAELSAATQAQKRLRHYGIEYTPNELTERGYKDCVKFWRKEYFKSDN